MNNDLGEKIRKYRKRKRMSQMDLELEIGASPGSISRIENGVVNPSKETIMKIIEMLDLNSIETASLFNIEIEEKIKELLMISFEIHKKKDIESIIDYAVNDIVFQLGLLAAFIVLKRADKLYLSQYTESWFTSISNKIIGKPLKTLNAPLDNNSRNLMVRSVLDNKIYISNSHSDFLVPAVSKPVAKILERVSKVKTGIVIPLEVNEEIIGAIYFGKEYADSFNDEKEILTSFANHIAISLIRLSNAEVMI